MVVKNDICPYCGGDLQKRGKVKRLIRGPYGKKSHIYVERYSCKKCGRWHRLIPNDILPYKQYLRDVVEMSLKDILEEDLRYEDYPSDITKYRWKKYPEGKLPKTRRK